MFEAFLIWAPKRSASARRLLDPRAVFSGVWIQQVVHIYGDEGAPMKPNRFAVFSIAYRKSDDSYAVKGNAYDGNADEHARWWSVDVVHFAKDGRAMTYLWEGTITNKSLREGDPERTGFARLDLASDDGGSGRVEHVSLKVNLEFNMIRVTRAWLAKQKLDAFEPDKLRDPTTRDQFATAYAKTLPAAT